MYNPCKPQNLRIIPLAIVSTIAGRPLTRNIDILLKSHIILDLPEQTTHWWGQPDLELI
jgi:hypothetical protein